MEVYADVLVVVNYVINLLVLMAAAKLAGVVTRRGRLGLGALTGALGALVSAGGFRQVTNCCFPV